MSTIEELERIVAPAVAQAGLELVDVEVVPTPRVLRVRVDSPGAGVALDDLGPLAKEISRLVDEHDAMPGGHYDLEVSSPGLERPLRRPDHFRKAVGSPVKIRTRAGADGERRVEGILAAADDDGIRVESEDRTGGARHIAYGDIERARTVFDWQAALAGGTRPSARSGAAPGASAHRPRGSADTEPARDKEKAARS